MLFIERDNVYLLNSALCDEGEVPDTCLTPVGS